RLSQELVVRHPRVLPREVRLDREQTPLFQHLVEVLRSSPREEPQRIAHEIDFFFAVFAPGNVEFVPEASERIVPIQVDREVASGLERLAHHLATEVPGREVESTEIRPTLPDSPVPGAAD